MSRDLHPLALAMLEAHRSRARAVDDLGYEVTEKAWRAAGCPIWIESTPGPVPRRDLPTAVRELLAHLDALDMTIGYETREAANVVRAALAHHETHGSREPAGPAERYSALHREMQGVWDRMEETWWDLTEDQREAFRAEGMLRPSEDIPEDAAPDPHHEADATSTERAFERVIEDGSFVAPPVRAHHETHGSREIHPLLLALHEQAQRPSPRDGDMAAFDEPLNEWLRLCCPIYAAASPQTSILSGVEDSTFLEIQAEHAAPDPHHEDDAARVRRQTIEECIAAIPKPEVDPSTGRPDGWTACSKLATERLRALAAAPARRSPNKPGYYPDEPCPYCRNGKLSDEDGRRVTLTCRECGRTVRHAQTGDYETSTG